MIEPIRLCLIYGSTRRGRFCDTVAAWAENRIWERRGFELDTVDPATLALPSAAQPDDEIRLERVRRQLEHADAFVVVTPEYNHGYTASLKNLIDSVREEWRAKPVAFISYGGISGGLRAVEQLRLVFAELEAVTIRNTVSFANARARFDDDGNLVDPEPAHAAMCAMLDRLRWWATALRRARFPLPYDQWQAA